MLTIGNYGIVQSGNVTTIDYRRGIKDWVDSVSSTVIGLAALGFSVVLFTRTHPGNFIFLFIGGLFGLVGLYRLWVGIVLLFKPTQHIVVISKDKKQLTAKYPAFKTTTVDLGSISEVVLRGTHESIKAGNTRRLRIYVTVDIATKGGSFIPVLTINPTQIVRMSDEEIELGIRETGEALSALLAGELGVKHQWTGFQRIYS
ncbi:MAG: hypothetical protein P4L51_16965 [Puia sp.]|nr:hypothetical protein [Puia sp.]